MLPATRYASSLSGLASRRVRQARVGASRRARPDPGGRARSASWLSQGAAKEIAITQRAARRPAPPSRRRQARARPRLRGSRRGVPGARRRSGGACSRGGASEQARPSIANAGRAEPGELPEPVEGAVDDPVGEARRAPPRRRRAPSGSGPARRAAATSSAARRPASGEQRPEQPRLAERAQLDAVGVAGRLGAAPVQRGTAAGSCRRRSPPTGCASEFVRATL